jgi:DNA-binding Xre family transcriptional regulator
MPKGTNTPVGLLSAAISELLHARMAYLRSNKSKLAEAAGVPRTTLGPIIDGKKTFDVEVLDRICRALGLDVVNVMKEADATTQRRLVEMSVRPIIRGA